MQCQKFLDSLEEGNPTLPPSPFMDSFRLGDKPRITDCAPRLSVDWFPEPEFSQVDK